MKKPTKRQIQKILSECAFNPNEAGHMKVISDVGDPSYYQMRAVELIQSQRASSNNFSCVPDLQMAISLLALSIAQLENKEQSNGSSNGRSQPNG